MKMTFKESLGFTVVSLLIPCLLLCLQAGCSPHSSSAFELQPLQGTWEGVILGQESDNKVTITFTGNSLHFQWLEGNLKGNWYQANFTLPARTSPQQLRATITGYYPTNDTGTRDIGAVVTAIFKIEDGTLTLAGIQGTDQEPPKGTEAFEKSTMFRYVLRRVQKENAEASKAR
jgi:uncharacterized protein (TIGR03067 family)